uniref:Tr-type G domain-containing protein n=1 Tax=Arcella intermedia TaxID=1963864 RepID=A0A6B2KXQ7_9EUKA
MDNQTPLQSPLKDAAPLVQPTTATTPAPSSPPTQPLPQKDPLSKKAEENDSDSDSDDWEWVEFESLLEEEIPTKHRPKQAVEGEDNNSTEDIKKNQQAKLKQITKQRYTCNAAPETLREPIVVVLGHVDAGKTTLLDSLRQTHVQAGEAGGITQQIGATHIPLAQVKHLTNELNQNFNFELKLPGFVFIDTPGHESFSNMRVRGSSLCDIAVLVVDIKHGLQTQTIESLKLLTKGRTRFVIALNKVDLVPGWVSFPNTSFREALAHQSKLTQEDFKVAVKQVRDQLSDHGIIAVPYWSVKDLNVQIPIIPLTAFNGCGIPDLLLFTMMYAQSMLTERLAKKDKLECSVLEVQEAVCMGHTIDVLLINGELHLGDKLMLCSTEGPIVTHLRTIIETKEMLELKGKGDKDIGNAVKSVKAVRGVKLWAKNLETVLSGTSLHVVGPNDDEQLMRKYMQSQMENLQSRLGVGGGSDGVHVQASTLGSLEALLEFLNQNGVAVGSFGIGQVNAKDVKKANSGQKLLLAFDVKIARQAASYADANGIEIIQSSVIYQLFAEFQIRKRKYLATIRKDAEQKPCILSIAPSYIINTGNPLIIGVTVELGAIGLGTRLYLHNDTYLGEVDVLKEVSSGHAVFHGAEGFVYIIQISRVGQKQQQSVVYGRDFFEDNLLYSKVTLKQMNQLEFTIGDHQKKLLAKYRSWHGFDPYTGPRPTHRTNH